MSQPVVYVDTSMIEPGSIAALTPAMRELADFVRTNEPQLLAYQVYFSEDGSRMTVLHVNPDSASLKLHMEVAGPRFAPIGKFIRLMAIDVYGSVEPDVVEALHRKARLLGGGDVRLHRLAAGFSRFHPSSGSL